MLSKIQLKNKLKVLFVESNKAPVVSAQVWVKTGSADESKGLEGISHFIEHLVFKGTQKFDVGEIAKKVEGAGGELNAFTTFDHTVFYVTISKYELNLALECLSEMMGFPKFDQGEIDKEREVVIEEIKRSFDSPHQVASQQLFSTLFKKHPYGIPIIGFEKNIRQVKRQKLIKYFNQRYVPSNMTLVLAGDFEPPAAKKLVKDHFGLFKKNRLKKVKRKNEPRQKQMVYSYRLSDFKEAQLNIAFKAPELGHKDVAALDLLGLILGSGDSSRLVKKLRLEKPLVISVGAGGYHPKDKGLFAFFLSLKAENLREVIQVSSDELLKAVTEAVTDDELSRAKLNIQSDEVYGLETVDGLARKVGSFQTLLSDPEYIQKYMHQIHKLTPTDLLKVARKYIHPKGLNLTLLMNKKDESLLPQKEFFELAKGVERRLTQAVSKKLKIKLQKNKSKAEVKIPLLAKSSKFSLVKHDLESGAKLIFKRNTDVPLMSVRIGFLGGARLETNSQLGLTTLLSNTWTSGTANRDEEKIAKEIESAAAHLSAFGGRNTLGLNLDCLKSHFDNVKETFEDICIEAKFPQRVVEREAQIQLHNLKSREDNPASLAMQKFMEGIFEGHPYSRDILGSESFLTRAQSNDLHGFFENVRTSSNAVIVVAGDFNEEKVERYFQSLTSRMEVGAKMEKKFPIKELKQSTNQYFELQKAQSHIVMGYRGLTLNDPRKFALELVQAVLSGQGGRLFLELRDKASLAYTVSPIAMNGLDAGYFGAYIGCSPEKGQTAIKMLNVEFHKLVQEKLSQDELERAKRYLIGQNHIGLQRNGAQATSILFDEIYGIDGMEAFKYADHINQVTANDVLSLAQDLFTKPAVTVAYGSISPF